MAKQKRPYPLGHYRLRAPRNPKEDKQYPLDIEYILNGSPIRRSVNISVTPKDWNPKGNNGRGELRPSYGAEYARYNAILNDKVNKIDASLNGYNQMHPNQITSEVVLAFLEDKPITRRDKGEDFGDFVMKRLQSEYSRNKIKYSRFKNGESAMRIFAMFLRATNKGTHKPDGIYIGEVSEELIDAYIDWRRNIKGNSDETINHALTPILKGCAAAAEMDVIDKALNAAIQDMRIQTKPKLESDDEKEYDGKSLSKEQLTKLVDFYSTDKYPRRKDYIEMFLFAFHACGLRIVDVLSLQWGHVNLEKKELNKVLVKTSKRHIIPLTDSAIKILKKWRAKRPNSKYVFDVVPDDLNLDNEPALYRARNSGTKTINQALAVIGQQLDLPFTLSFHVARHTFAVLAINDGMTMTILSRLLGHSSTDVTERVYARFLPDTLNSEVEKLNYCYLPSDENLLK